MSAQLLARSAVGEDLSVGDSTPVAETAVANSAGSAPLPIDTLVKIYVKIRDAKSAAKRVFDAAEKEFNAKIDMIGTELKARAQAEGVEGFKTEFGTVYLSETMKTSCADWGAFGEFLQTHDPLEFMEKRISATAVKGYMKQNNGELPPGVSVFKEIEARVRKAGEKA